MATIPGVMFVPHAHEVTQIPDGDWIAFGSHGGDTIFGGDGNDIIFGGNGNDLIVGGHGNDMIFGGNGNDMLIGGDGHDTLFGGDGHDTMIGGTSDTLFVGGRGGDLMISGAGNDTMLGGAGHDTFVFGSGGGRDVVMDFQHGDVLQIQRNINGLHVTQASDLLSHMSSDGHGNTVIDLGHGDSVTLVGVKPEELHHDLSSYIKIN